MTICVSVCVVVRPWAVYIPAGDIFVPKSGNLYQGLWPLFENYINQATVHINKMYIYYEK